MNNVQEAITVIREAIKKRVRELKTFEAMTDRTNNVVLMVANRGAINKLESLLSHLLPEEKE